MRGLFPIIICGALWGCSAEAPLPGSCVLITLDTTNPAALDVYETQRGITPNLSSLAREGIVFDDARAVAPITIISHASMLTGLYPPRHGVRDNGYKSLPLSAETIAERAQRAGCRTGAVVAASVLQASYGLAQGFDDYNDAHLSTDNLGGVGDRTGEEITKAALEWLDGREELQPFFLWVHYFDPHAPYEPSQEFLAQAAGKPYLGEVAAMDAAIGPLLTRLRAEPDYDDLTILVVADHGESGGKHGESSHGLLCYDSTLRVPLIVRLPGAKRAGQRSSERVSIVDVYPTILDAMGLGAPPSDGLSLIRGDIPRERGVYFETYYGFLNYGWGHLAGWAGPEGKYIHGPSPEFYDVSQDPGELTNLVSQSGMAVSRAREAMTRIAQAGALERASGETAAVNPEGMQGLGYAGAASLGAVLPAPASVSTLPTPSQSLQEHYAVWSALAQSDMGRKKLAIRELNKVIAQNPRNSFAHSILGEILMEAKQYREAIRVLSAMVDLGLDRPRLRGNLALAHANLGEYEQALTHTRAYQAFCPGDPKVAKFKRDMEKRKAAAQSSQGADD